MTLPRKGFYVRPDGLAGIDKVPAEAADYSLDWADEVKAGESITDVEWVVPAGINGGGSGQSGVIVTKRISGGTVGTEYTIGCTVTKSTGEVIPRVFVVNVVSGLS